MAWPWCTIGRMSSALSPSRRMTATSAGSARGSQTLTDDGLVVFERARRHRELVDVVHPGVRTPVAEVVVVGEHGDRAGRVVVLRDDAEMAVEQAGHLLRDLAQQLGQVELARDGDGGLDEGLELALAGEAGGEVVAAADEGGELLDVLLLDAPMPARGARAGKEAGRGPAPDGVRRHAEPAGRVLHAQVHVATVPTGPPASQLRGSSRAGGLRSLMKTSGVAARTRIRQNPRCSARADGASSGDPLRCQGGDLDGALARESARGGTGETPRAAPRLGRDWRPSARSSAPPPAAMRSSSSICPSPGRLGQGDGEGQVAWLRTGLGRRPAWPCAALVAVLEAGGPSPKAPALVAGAGWRRTRPRRAAAQAARASSARSPAVRAGGGPRRGRPP